MGDINAGQIFLFNTLDHNTFVSGLNLRQGEIACICARAKIT